MRGPPDLQLKAMQLRLRKARALATLLTLLGLRREHRYPCLGLALPDEAPSWAQSRSARHRYQHQLRPRLASLRLQEQARALRRVLVALHHQVRPQLQC